MNHQATPYRKSVVNGNCDTTVHRPAGANPARPRVSPPEPVASLAPCVETRAADPRIASLVAPLEDEPTRLAVTAERAFLHRLEGGCQVPIAGHATLTDDRLAICGLVAELTGQSVFRETRTGPAAQAAVIGRQLADLLLDQGARAVLDRLQTERPS